MLLTFIDGFDQKKCVEITSYLPLFLGSEKKVRDMPHFFKNYAFAWYSAISKPQK
jgi:hypothetical protein